MIRTMVMVMLVVMFKTRIWMVFNSMTTRLRCRCSRLRLLVLLHRGIHLERLGCLRMTLRASYSVMGRVNQRRTLRLEFNLDLIFVLIVIHLLGREHDLSHIYPSLPNLSLLVHIQCHTPLPLPFLLLLRRRVPPSLPMMIMMMMLRLGRRTILQQHQITSFPSISISISHRHYNCLRQNQNALAHIHSKHRAGHTVSL